MSIYEASDDSYLLLRHVKSYAKGRILDLGSGSGIIAEECLKYSSNVTAADISEEAIEYLVSKFGNKITIIRSDLFSNIAGKYDVIFFNPPYLPEEGQFDIALDGGKKGYELIFRFLKEVKNHLKTNGKILMVFSSFTKKEKVDKKLRDLKFEHTQIAVENLFFEKLYLYKINF